MSVAAKAIRLAEFGPASVMRLEDVTLDRPKPGEVLVRQTAIGINFVDIQQRRGTGYALPLPTGLGHEAAGVVEAVGESAGGIPVGARVAYMGAGAGAYATHRLVPAAKVVPIPDGIGDEAAAALLFKGLTAQYLIRHTREVRAGDRLLVHAAAGGVGLILTRWAAALGAEVFGTAGSPEKCATAEKAGCAAAFDYSAEGWPQKILARFGDRKADIVYDSVGKATFLHSLDLARPFGTVVVFGAASGPAPAIEPELLNRKGCLFLTRPSVFPHNADPARFRANAADLFDAVARGHVAADIGLRLPLSEAAEAHRAIEARETSGAVVLIP